MAEGVAMEATIVRSTLPGYVTIVCSDCGVSLGFDIPEESYNKSQHYWDEFICPECRGYKGGR